MGKETIELLKNYDPSKMQFPAGFQQKFDGVPAKITRNADGTITALTRQGETIKSIDHIIAASGPILLLNGSFIVGELYDPTIPFKTISGQVRDTKQQHTNLRLYVFDGDVLGGDTWLERHDKFVMALGIALQAQGLTTREYPIRCISTFTVNSDAEVQAQMEILMQFLPQAEGAVLHSYGKKWNPGKRCWGTQRIKPQPTIDLKVVGFEEAISEAGDLKGMVGRINVEFNGKVIGIGPGKMTHAERTELWQVGDAASVMFGRICEIKYMPDSTYDALRQPTFQRWRPDKTVADVYTA